MLEVFPPSPITTSLWLLSHQKNPTQNSVWYNFLKCISQRKLFQKIFINHYNHHTKIIRNYILKKDIFSSFPFTAGTSQCNIEAAVRKYLSRVSARHMITFPFIFKVCCGISDQNRQLKPHIQPFSLIMISPTKYVSVAKHFLDSLKSGIGCCPIALIPLSISIIVSHGRNYSRIIILYLFVWLTIQIHVKVFNQF